MEVIMTKGEHLSRIVTAALAVVLGAASAAAQTTPPAAHEGPTVSATGEAVVRRSPDRAWVQTSVETRARSPREAQKLNADAMAAVLQKLRAANPGADAIQTRGYELHPEYDFSGGRQTVRGYVARNTIEIRVDEIARLGEFLDLVVSAGATSAGQVRFDLKDRDGAEREALKLAVEDARRRAEAAASGAGMRVERIVRIEEHRLGGIEPPRPMVAMRQAEMAAAEPQIEPGQLDIRAAVTVVAAIR
jgi:uncharacterized protein YggE